MSNFDEDANPFTLRARLPLKFLIVGASITGLACAYNLKMAGHHVRVIEKDDGVGKGTGGVKCPPNMARLLYRWGLEKRLEKIGTRCPQISFKIANTGEDVGAMLFNDMIVRELGAGLFFLSHSDLHKMLYEIVTKADIKVEFNSTVVEVDSTRPSVTLANGTEIAADIIVGADGAQSILRRSIIRRTEVLETGPFPIYSFLVPCSSMKNDKEIDDLRRNPMWNFWMGEGCAILTHPADGGNSIAVYFVWPESKDKALPGWRTRVPYNTITEWPGFEPRIQRLMELAPSEGPIQTKHIIHPTLEDWYNDEKNIVLMGEAVDVINPGALHATAMCIEDAAVFGNLFSRIQERNQISKLLAAYQELRSERRQVVKESEYLKTHFLCIPSGPLQILRNDSLRKADATKMNDWETGVKEEWLEHNWGLEYEGPFNYDAYEAVDEWWVEWGIISQRAHQREPIDAVQLQFSVITTEKVDEISY